MQTHYGKTQSLWMHEEDVPRFPPLDANRTADVCVVGGGIAGLSCAWMLLREGRSVVVLESGVLARGETSRTTAHLSFALDDRYYKLERLFGKDGARRAYGSHAGAVDTIEDIVNREQIDCEFTRLDGYLFGPPNEPKDELEREFHAARRAGVPVDRVDRAPLASFDTGRCLRFSNQRQLNPIRFVSGLADAIVRMGGRILTGTHVRHVTGGSRPYVETSKGIRVGAGAVILATNTPINSNLTIHIRQAPYRTYVIGASVPWDACRARSIGMCSIHITMSG